MNAHAHNKKSGRDGRFFLHTLVREQLFARLVGDARTKTGSALDFRSETGEPGHT